MRKLILSLILIAGSLLTSGGLWAQCTSNAGTLQGPATLTICAQEQLFITSAADVVLDSNDVQRFVCYTGASPISGTILADGPNGLFNPASFVSAPADFKVVSVVGTNNGSGGVDWTDACLSISAPVMVHYAALPVIIEMQDIHLTCSTVTVQIQGASTTPGSTFAWSGPGGIVSNTAFVTIQSPGIYTLTVTSPEGCTATDDVIVTQDITVPTLNVVPQVISCDPYQVQLTAVSFSPDAIFVWTGPNAFTTFLMNPIVTIPGVYTCIVTSTNSGCTSTQTVTVSPNIQANASIAVKNDCSERSLTVVAPPGTYSYLWSDGSTNKSIQNPAAGTYCVTVTGVGNTCSATACASITPINLDFCGKITGKVTLDPNQNCLYDPGEPGNINWLIRADSSNGTQYFGTIAATGDYELNLPLGDWTVHTDAGNALWEPCNNDIPVSLTVAQDSVNVDISVKELAYCPVLSVDLSSLQLRRCFSSNYYVSYCNHGTAPATDAYIDVTLDPFLSFIDAPLPYQDLGNNKIRFFLDEVGVGQCDNFFFQVYVSCNSTLGQTHCSEAHIYPDSSCLPVDPMWSGASLEVQAQCIGDSLYFNFYNIGAGDMTVPLEFIVIEDGVMLLEQSSGPLQSGSVYTYAVPANGATWHVEADQEPHHPGQSMPALSVEGCTTTNTFSTGYATQFAPNDADAWLDIDCTTNIGSYDPNDKQGFPIGYGNQHYIYPGTDLEYQIRFQNTGTDTAFNIRVVDTLSHWLDLNTMQPGASSHTCRFERSGQNILTFYFDNIMLPDSNVNQLGSNGFVKFRISQRADVPLETDILNSAAIYFDFNDPVITNTTQHRVGLNFVTVATWHPVKPELSVAIAPNPMEDEAILQINGLPIGTELLLNLYDLQGKSCQQLSGTAPQISIRRNSLPTGLYLLRLSTADGKLLGSGKLMVGG